ncbi:transcriptional regulator, Sir2 family [Leptospira weilii serovar Ranarum str. ICFT]|uniref:NAD-dependent protein deacylase n=1 Tax=Leptospira weilii serovar Ranarum str. ICFT TaxID=1218598 RepID=N1WT85_9LEPT|nr:NAD-dependent deacylase [Leptospira weilii]EMY79048.1 transcriptional regulator, Sir2 family [Leptospira weilii serovar Ranarum str. ICFT]
MKELVSKHKHRFQKITAITGAGISAESGIPTFRGADGLWKNFRAEDLATPQAFQKNPELVWEWYLWRRGVIESKDPNLGHVALAELEKRHTDFFLITQNVDGLHSRAGSKKLIEIHGNIFLNCCSFCENKILINVRSASNEPLPKCNLCGSLFRPGVVWFGESYDESKLNQCIERMKNTDLLLIIGTSGAVSMPVYLAEIAQESGALLIEINPEKSSFSSSVDLFLKGKSGEILPELVNEIIQIL